MTSKNVIPLYNSPDREKHQSTELTGFRTYFGREWPGETTRSTPQTAPATHRVSP